MMSKIYVGSFVFQSKKEAIDACRRILYRYPLGATVNDEDSRVLHAIFALHPRHHLKVKCGVLSFQVDTNHPYTTRGFWLTRHDGSRTDWSFLDCLTHPSDKKRVYTACRDLIAPQIASFRASVGQCICPVTGDVITSTPDTHVHHEPPFESLVQSFLAERGLPISAELIRSSQDGETRELFADLAVAEAWKDYHLKHAVLRLVSARGHLQVLHGRR
jgi:hypothetical protein